MEQQYCTRGDTSVALGAGGDQDGQDQSLCAGNWGPWKRTPNVVQRDADDTPNPRSSRIATSSLASTWKEEAERCWFLA